MNITNNIKSPTVLYLGSNGFPFGSATIQRQISISKALSLAGFQIVVLNTRSGHSKKLTKRENIKIHGYYQGIEYYYTSIIPYRTNNFALRNINRLFGNINELFLIVFLKLFKNAKYIIIHAYDLNVLKYYFFLSRFFKLELIYDYVEFYDSVNQRDVNDMNKIASRFDHEFYKYTDKIIVISSYLQSHIKRMDPKKRTIKIPPLIDFDYYNEHCNRIMNKSSFLFCANIKYNDLIHFIIDVYEKSKARAHNLTLKLVLNGNDRQILKVQKHIEDRYLNDFIFIYSRLPYKELVELYKDSLALLIPITNNIQDQARFPYKICEYTAARRPIITSETPTILEYFENRKEAYLCEVNSKEDFIKNINYVIDNPNISDIIGLNGYNKGSEVFNYKNYSQVFKDFLK